MFMYLKTIKKIHVGYLDKKKSVTCFLEFKWVRSINKVTDSFNWYVNKYGPVKHLLFLLKRSIIKNDIYLKNCSLPGYVANLTQTGWERSEQANIRGVQNHSSRRITRKNSVISHRVGLLGRASVNRPRKVEMGKILVGWK